MIAAKDLQRLIQFQVQARIWHWQSDQYSEHTAFGKLYSDLDGLVDGLIEGLMGRDREKPLFGSMQLVIEEYFSFDNSLAKMEEFVEFCKTDLMNSTDARTSPDVQNTIAGLIDTVNRVKYLGSLR